MHGYKEIEYPTAEKLNAEAENGWRLKCVYFPQAHIYPGRYVGLLEKELPEGETLDPAEVTATSERPKSNPIVKGRQKTSAEPKPGRRGRKKE
jgi:hypothetical protein